MVIDVVYVLFILFNAVLATRDTGRIIGGRPIAVHESPHQVTLFTKVFEKLYFFCGGVILSPEWIITAGHCGQGKEDIYIVAGTYNICDKSGILSKSESLYMHPKFDIGTLNYDVFLIKLQNPLNLGTSSINKINLVNPCHHINVGQSLTITGFGTTLQDGESNCLLLGTEVYYANHSICSEIYGVELPTQFCAGVLEGGKDTCQGDSGGPVVDSESGLLLGLTSYGEGCGVPGIPGVYTDLRTVRIWIKQITNI